MKLKEQEVEKEGMNKELYDLFIDVIQFEYNKCSFLKGVKFYCWAHGLEDYTRFYKAVIQQCSECKNDFIYHILGRFEIIPEIKIQPLKVEYESAENTFELFAEKEEEFIALLEKLIAKAKEVNDYQAEAFLLPILGKMDHIACRALAAVKEKKDPSALIEIYPW